MRRLRTVNHILKLLCITASELHTSVVVDIKHLSEIIMSHAAIIDLYHSMTGFVASPWLSQQAPVE